MTVEQYLADVGEDQTEEEFWADLEERGTQALKAQIILDKVADDHSIGVDQNDLTQHVLRKAQAEGVPPQQVADHLQEHPHHIEEYMLEIRRGKALAMIVESATVTDSDGSVVQLANLQEDGSYAEPQPADDVDAESAGPTAGDVDAGSAAAGQQVEQSAKKSSQKKRSRRSRPPDPQRSGTPIARTPPTQRR